MWLIGYPALAAETLTLVADRWCPYNCDSGSDRPGFMIEIAQKAFARHQIAVDYQIMPWTRAIEETRKGKFSGIVGASLNDAPDFIFPKLPQGWMQNRMFVKKGSTWRYKGIDSLSGISLGVIAGYSYNDELDEYIKKHRNDLRRVQIVSGDDALEMNVQKLLAGRVDAIIEDTHVMHYHLSSHAHSDPIEEAGLVKSSRQDELFIAFSPRHPRSQPYADILSREMKAMRASGELQRILARYMVADRKR